MAFIPIVAMVRKDLQLFFGDRRSVIVSFVVPIAIASFFGSIFSGPGSNGEPARIAVAIVDQDSSAISKAIVAGAQGDRNLRLATLDEAAARGVVRNGKTAVAVVIPKGFGEAAGESVQRTLEQIQNALRSHPVAEFVSAESEVLSPMF